jgi:hypothetical protein
MKVKQNATERDDRVFGRAETISEGIPHYTQ